jgi:hypothetical protein
MTTKMKLSDATTLASPAFKEVYRLFNFNDDDELKDYCDFVLHEPVEWMRGFPASWKSTTMFSKPRAAFHKLMKSDAVVQDLGAAYCENVHNVVWKSFKEHMTAILEKRNNNLISSEIIHCNDDESVCSEKLSTTSIEELHPVPHVPTLKVANWKQVVTIPENNVVYSEPVLDYKQKYKVLRRVVDALLAGGDLSVHNALSILLDAYDRC